MSQLARAACRSVITTLLSLIGLEPVAALLTSRGSGEADRTRFPSSGGVKRKTALLC